MIGPIETAVLQSVGDVLFNSRFEIFDVCISEPGIFELADIETQLSDHRLEARIPSCACASWRLAL
jgi:hypothetical protein